MSFPHNPKELLFITVSYVDIPVSFFVQSAIQHLFGFFIFVILKDNNLSNSNPVGFTASGFIQAPCRNKSSLITYVESAFSFQSVLDVISKELDRLQHAHIFSCHYLLPISLKTSMRATHHVASVGQWKNNRVAILLHEGQTMHCNHFRMQGFYCPFHFSLILWLKVWHVEDQILAEMMSISPNIMVIVCNVTSVNRKTVN